MIPELNQWGRCARCNGAGIVKVKSAGVGLIEKYCGDCSTGKDLFAQSMAQVRARQAAFAPLFDALERLSEEAGQRKPRGDSKMGKLR